MFTDFNFGDHVATLESFSNFTVVSPEPITSYPAPSITAETLVLFLNGVNQTAISPAPSGATAYSIDYLREDSDDDVVVTFTGSNFGVLADYVTVQYTGPETHTCQVRNVSDISITCALEQVVHLGGLYYFDVYVKDQSSGPGADYLDIPAQPIMKTVSGCETNGIAVIAFCTPFSF